jgi:hypothetical protein
MVIVRLVVLPTSTDTPPDCVIVTPVTATVAGVGGATGSLLPPQPITAARSSISERLEIRSKKFFVFIIDIF